MNRVLFFISIAFAFCSCAVQRATTSEEFVRDIQKDIPFKVTELKAVSGHDNTYSFRSDAYIGLLPDYEVDSDGASMIFETTFAPTHNTHSRPMSSGATSSSTARQSVSSVSTVSS